MDLTRIQGGQRVAIVLRRAHCKSIAGISISISTSSIARSLTNPYLAEIFTAQQNTEGNSLLK